MLFPDAERAIGKVVLTELSPGEFRLFAKQAAGFDWWIQAVEGDEREAIFTAMRELPTTRGFDESFGFHKDIAREGKLRGGGIALWLDNKLYIEGFSQAFGPMVRNQVREALEYISRNNDFFLYELGEQLIDVED